MTTIFNSPEELAAAKAAAEFSDYQQKRAAEELQLTLENELAAAIAAHREANAHARELADDAVSKHSVKIARALVAFRDELDAINAVEEKAREAAVEARAALHPSIRRSSDLGPVRDHGKPAKAGHVVAGVLERVMREHDITLPEKHWSSL